MKAGFLFASPVIIELYSWFTEFRRKDAALDSFEQVCGKITAHGLSDWKKDWRILTSLQSPAWYASSHSGDRRRLILGFNSPFYPNVLVAVAADRKLTQ